MHVQSVDKFKTNAIGFVKAKVSNNLLCNMHL